MESIKPEPGLLSNGWFLVVLLAIVLLYYHYTATFDIFQNMGVPYLKPIIFFGNGGDLILQKTSYYEFLLSIYQRFKGFKMVGLFEGPFPFLMIRDPELIKTIMVKDFDHFMDNWDVDFNDDAYLSKMLFRLKGKEWKTVRSFVTPVFSTAKLRSMDPLIQQGCLQTVQFLKQRPVGDTEVEMKQFTSRYSLQVIGSCAFGIDCASLAHSDSEFMKEVGGFLDISIYERVLLTTTLLLCPSILKYVPVNLFNQATIKYLTDITLKTMKKRISDPSNRRNDFIQLLADKSLKEESSGEKKVLNDDMVVGLALAFYFAGFETSSTLLSFTCMILAHTPDIQDRLRKDIQDAMKDGQGRPCYELVNEIPLLEQVMMESLRMYPPLHRIERVCTKPYTFPGTNVTLKVGDVVIIPVAGIMKDPEFYPDPEKFDTERFTPGVKKRQDTFLAFGMGPRTCIGMRFAMLTTKLYILHMLNNFKILPSDKTKLPITFDKKSVLPKSAGGTWVHLEPLVPVEC